MKPGRASMHSRATRLRSSRMQRAGWMVVLGVAVAAFLALTFKVNAVRGEVRLAERQIIALKRETLLLETEFQSRASQRQLAQWNEVEFGYIAPRSGQLLESDQRLALLGLPRGSDAPEPIRVAVQISDTTPQRSSWSFLTAPSEGKRIARAAGSRPAFNVALAEGSR